MANAALNVITCELPNSKNWRRRNKETPDIKRHEIVSLTSNNGAIKETGHNEVAREKKNDKNNDDNDNLYRIWLA